MVMLLVHLGECSCGTQWKEHIWWGIIGSITEEATCALGRGGWMTSQKMQAEDITQIRYRGIKGSLWNAISSYMGKWVQMELKI